MENVEVKEICKGSLMRITGEDVRAALIMAVTEILPHHLGAFVSKNYYSNAAKETRIGEIELPLNVMSE